MRVLWSLPFVLVAACGTSSPSGPDGGGGDGGTDANNTSNGTWTQVLVSNYDGGVDFTTEPIPTGVYFDSLTNGVVSYTATAQNNGAPTIGFVEHFTAPTTMDVIALDGTGKLPGPADDVYAGFIKTSAGLVARGTTDKFFVSSTNGGKSFSYSPMSKGGMGQPTAQPMWMGSDSSGTWRLADWDGVYKASTAPGSSTSFSLTWQDQGNPPYVPTPLPSTDCGPVVAPAWWVSQGYYTEYPTTAFAVSPDMSVMVYAGGGKVCRLTDEKTGFVDVTNNISWGTFSTSNVPWVMLMASATVGIAAYGTDLDNPGSAYVLYTSDGGQHWTLGTLPQSAMNTIALVNAFASPSGTLFLVGAGDSLFPNQASGSLAPLLYRSKDGGKTWTDMSANLASWNAKLAVGSGAILGGGFALDDQHIWVYGDNGDATSGDGFLAYTATGGQ